MSKFGYKKLRILTLLKAYDYNEGEVTFADDLSVFMPYLRASGLLHVGKACPMGLGHYTICNVS